MGITLKQIAELAGVSRGTVDRALHGRGRVKPEIEKKIQEIAKELGYRPNPVGRALSLKQKSTVLGIIVQSSITPFMQMVIKGVDRATEELHDFGVDVEIELLESADAKQTIAAIDRLVAKGVQGIAMTALDDEHLRDKIDWLADYKNIPVVTFNSDILGTKRLCYVGQDPFRSGQTCAFLMSMALRGSGKVFPITGHLTNFAHQQRHQGFVKECELHPGLELLALQSCFDKDSYAYELTIQALQEHPDLVGIFVSANGQGGVCRALRDTGRKSQVTVIAYDITPQNRELMRTGQIDILIGQGATQQGYQPLMLLYNYLLHGTKIEQEFLYTDIVIKTRYNL